MTTVLHPSSALHLHDVSNFLGQPQESQKQHETLSEPTLSMIIQSEPPEHAVSVLPKWNQSKINIFKTLSTFFGFIIMGANDAVYGAIIPYLQAYYNVSYTVVSLVFLSPMIGYVSAAMLNNTLHKAVGRRGVAIIGPSAHLIAYIIISLHPPYPVLVAVFIFAGFGTGVLDAAWNAWLGNLANPNELLGFLHGFYGVGATVAPIVATSMITRGSLPWYSFYYIMIGGAGLELATSTAAFWKETSTAFRTLMSTDVIRGATRAAIKTRVAWVTSLFLLVYVGIEVALGGWIVNFMIEVRKGAEFESGLVATGFWLGLTVGRVTLGFVTPRLGEKLAVCVYLIVATVLQLLFWLIPSFTVSSISIALIGFVLGPLFPAVVVTITRVLPLRLHIATIGFAAAFGGSGACVFPFAIGAIAQHAGLSVLQPVILGMLLFAVFLWAIGMPSMSKKDGKEMKRLVVMQEKLKLGGQAVKRAFLSCASHERTTAYA